MFELELSAEERLIQETARRFAAERLAARLRDHERARGLSSGFVQEFSTLGLAAVDRPAAVGGQGLSTFCKVLVLEELGAVDAGAALALDPIGLAAYALLETPSQPAALDLLRRAAPVCAIDDAEACLRVDDRVASGVFAWVPAEEIAGVVILREKRAWVVTEGIELARVQPCGLEAAGASELRLNRVPIAFSIDDGDAVDRARARMRLHVAALLVGVARAACTYATRYAAERTAFGRPIAHHQALAFLLVDMATAVDAARMAVWRAAAAIDHGAESAWAGASAFAEAAEQALFVAPSAVQVLGGHGFMKDYPVEKYMRDARTLAQLAGGRDRCELEAAAVVVDHDLGLS
jgi:alkylation response protein AidB-like acyl-CoA dehydrogenase